MPSNPDNPNFEDISGLDEATRRQVEEDNLQQDASDQTDGASENISDNASRGNRGTPILDMERPTNRQLERAGEARINALTSMFGEDALVLGHLLFAVPPLAIRINKGHLTYRWKPLRTKESIAVKSGNGECHIEIDLAFVGFNQISRSLQELIWLWKRAPITFIENIHIRKMMIPDRIDDSMAVCLRSLIMDVISGSPNMVYATLIMPWFNYKPFSANFYYRRDWRSAGQASVTSGSAAAGLGSGEPTANTNPGETDEDQQNDNEASRTQGRTLLTDIADLESVENLISTGVSYPPEFALTSERQGADPVDPLIAGTYPVVYPFNSTPFLEYVRAEANSVTPIATWSDGLTMSWNSFYRTAPSFQWQETRQRGQDTPPARQTSGPQTDGTQDTPEEESDLWTVCHISDGDTIWVWGTEDGERVVKKIRMLFCDAPETYHTFNDPKYNTGGESPLPEGQDSYRPSNAKYGTIAKNALSGAISGQQVSIEWYGQDVYNRELAVVFKGDTNINLWLVQEGYVFMEPNDSGTDSAPYVSAEREARGEGETGPKGIWASSRVPLSTPEGFPEIIRSHLEALMPPSLWRATYAPSSDFSSTSPPSDCNES